MTTKNAWHRVGPWLPAIGLVISLAAVAAWAPQPPPDARERSNAASPPPAPDVEEALSLAAEDPHAPAATPCFHGEDGALAPRLIPGSTRSSRSTFSAFNRTVDADNHTVLLARALSRQLDVPLAFQDVVNVTEERVEVCALDAATVIEREDALTALAVGARIPRDALVGLVGDTHLFTAYRTVTERNVTLDTDVALAALALGDGTLDPRDVLTTHESTRTDRVLVRVTDVDRGNVLALLALREGG